MVASDDCMESVRLQVGSTPLEDGRVELNFSVSDTGIGIDDEGAARAIEAIKQREHRGYSYEAADASFELLIRNGLVLDGSGAEAFEAEDAADSALADLYRRRARIAVSDRDFYTIVRSREFLTAEQFCEQAAALPGCLRRYHGCRSAGEGSVGSGRRLACTRER